MEIEKLPAYSTVVNSLREKKRLKHLLFGNGFSMAYSPGIFSYNALSNFIEQTDDELLRQLFQSLNTKNFELIMQQLDNFAEMAKIFSTDSSLIDRIHTTSDKLKTSLIEAVKELHPEHVFTIPDSACKACHEFLDDYLNNNGYVFSTNYDLLAYWVLMRNESKNANDGFGRELENEPGAEYVPDWEPEFSELRWGVNKKGQSIFYLHGSLPIFDTGIDIIKEQYDTDHYLLENIKGRMEAKEYPVFVTAGDGKQKLTHIMHNKYLSFCYEKLCTITGSLVTFGFNFGDYDRHIIDAINKACKYRKEDGGKLLSIYIGVYSDESFKRMRTLEKEFKCKVNYYNANTANLWGH